jgi:peptidyl-tRNA hydrolase
MKDFDSKEECDKRANQIDPIVMYLIVNVDLNMGCGKIASQCGHGVMKMTLCYFNTKDICCYEPFSQAPDWVYIFDDWLDTSFRKIVLRANQREFDKLKQELHTIEVPFEVVKDNGLTEVAPGSETVIGVYPMYKSKCPKIIRKLQALK